MAFTNNTKSSRLLFEGRKEYQDFLDNQSYRITQGIIMPENYYDTNKETIYNFNSLKNEKSLIGKTDLYQNCILPNQTKLKIIENSISGNRVLALDFVADAFADLTYNFNLNRNKPKTRVNEINQTKLKIEDFTAVRGFVNPELNYINFINSLFDSYLFELSRNKSLNESIVDLYTFFVSFWNFIESEQIKSPIFLSDFILSTNNSQLSSGLCVEISNYDVTNDQIKFDEFISSQYYSYYIEAASKFGFLVDHNIPWRMIADINSIQMKSYIYKNNPNFLDNRGISTDNILSTYYSLPQNEYTLFMTLVFNKYSVFINDSPSITKYYQNNCTSYQRDLIRKVENNSILFDKKFVYSIVPYLVNIKNQTSIINYQIELLNNIKITAKNIISSNDKPDNLMIYLNSKFSKINNQEGSSYFNLVKNKLINNTEIKTVKEVADFNVKTKSFKIY